MNHTLILTTKQSKPAGNTDIKIISFPEIQFKEKINVQKVGVKGQTQQCSSNITVFNI